MVYSRQKIGQSLRIKCGRHFWGKTFCVLFLRPLVNWFAPNSSADTYCSYLGYLGPKIAQGFLLLYGSLMTIFASSLVDVYILTIRGLLWFNIPFSVKFKMAADAILNLDYWSYLGHQCRYLGKIWYPDRHWPQEVYYGPFLVKFTMAAAAILEIHRQVYFCHFLTDLHQISSADTDCSYEGYREPEIALVGNSRWRLAPSWIWFFGPDSVVNEKIIASYLVCTYTLSLKCPWGSKVQFW